MPLLAIYYVCKEAEKYKDFSSMHKAFQRYYKSPVIDRTVVDKDATLA